jgi:hypothetical protein
MVIVKSFIINLVVIFMPDFLTLSELLLQFKATVIYTINGIIYLYSEN